MGFQTDLLTGLAADLHSGSCGTWRASGVYTVAETAIIFGNIPQYPDRCITLTAYGVSDDPSLSDSVIGVQVRTRWGGLDPRLVNDLDDLIFARLHGRTNFTVNGVVVVQCHRNSAGSLGQDQNGRWMNSSNYYFTVLRNSTYRT